MLKALLYLAGFLFLVLIVIGNTTALIVFFSLILILSIGNALIEKFEKKKSE